MRERPILFSGEMVRAILDGRKTVTRRVVRSQPRVEDGVFKIPRAVIHNDPIFKTPPPGCPYGQPGDRLWVRETWFCTGADESDGYPVRYRATADLLQDVSLSWRPSIFMPRWASRITLEVTGVRVERVQELTSADAEREGLRWDHLGWMDYGPSLGFKRKSSSVQSFQTLWDSINAKRGFGWDKNPWVWVVEFKRVTDA